MPWTAACQAPLFCLQGSSVHWDSPGRNTGVGCHAFLQGIFPTQGLNPGLVHCRWILYHASHKEAPLYAKEWYNSMSQDTGVSLSPKMIVNKSSHAWIFYLCSLQSVQFSRSIVSDSLQPHELQHARPPCPSPTPGVYPNSCPSSQWCLPAVSKLFITKYFMNIHSFSQMTDSWVSTRCQMLF